MSSTNFKKWIIEKHVPNLKETSIIVMDNALYHRICVNKMEKGIQLWLAQNKLECDEGLKKPQQLEIIKINRPEPIYKIEKILAENGHSCLYLPPYHCDLNPIELIWSKMKRNVAYVNIYHKSNEILRQEKHNSSKFTPLTGSWIIL